MFRVTHKFAIVVSAVALTTVACATPPQAQVDQATAALNEAATAQASEYAPDSFSAAKDAQAKLDAELKAQEGSFALTRSYGEAKKLATAATEAARKAAQDAVRQKAIAQKEASTAVADARTAIQDAEAALTGAPKGKGSKADLEALKSDLAAATSTLGEAEGSLKAERYADVKAKAAAAKEKATAVKSAVDQAIQARKGGRR